MKAGSLYFIISGRRWQLFLEFAGRGQGDLAVQQDLVKETPDVQQDLVRKTHDQEVVKQAHNIQEEERTILLEERLREADRKYNELAKKLAEVEHNLKSDLKKADEKANQREKIYKEQIRTLTKKLKQPVATCEEALGAMPSGSGHQLGGVQWSELEARPEPFANELRSAQASECLEVNANGLRSQANSFKTNSVVSDEYEKSSFDSSHTVDPELEKSCGVFVYIMMFMLCLIVGIVKRRECALERKLCFVWLRRNCFVCLCSKDKEERFVCRNKHLWISHKDCISDRNTCTKDKFKRCPTSVLVLVFSIVLVFVAAAWGVLL